MADGHTGSGPNQPQDMNLMADVRHIFEVGSRRQGRALEQPGRTDVVERTWTAVARIAMPSNVELHRRIAPTITGALADRTCALDSRSKDLRVIYPLFSTSRPEAESEARSIAAEVGRVVGRVEDDIVAIDLISNDDIEGPDHHGSPPQLSAVSDDSA